MLSLSTRLAAAITERIKSAPFQEVSPEHYEAEIAAMVEAEAKPLVEALELLRAYFDLNPADFERIAPDLQREYMSSPVGDNGALVRFIDRALAAARGPR